MKPGENERTTYILSENIDKVFSGFFQQMVKTNEDLATPIGDLIARWMDEVVSKDKNTPYKTRTGTRADIECNTHYRKLESYTVHLRDQKGIK